MNEVLNFLEQISAEDFSKDKLYGWISDHSYEDPKRKFDAFIPILNFIITFPYYNKLFLRYKNPENSESKLKDLKFVINDHVDEDATHAKLFVHDIKHLSLDKVWGLEYPSDLLWAIWSSPRLETSRRILQNRVEHLLRQNNDSPLFRYLHMEQIELDGHHLFSASNRASQSILNTYQQDSVYFGSHHLARESGHVGNSEFRQVQLTSEEKQIGIDIVKNKHRLSLEMNQFMLDFAKECEPLESAGTLLRKERQLAVDSVSKKVVEYVKGNVPALSWSISPCKDKCDPELFEEWHNLHFKFRNHELSKFLIETKPEDCEYVAKATLLFFANRMLSLRSFNLYDLELPEEKRGTENTSMAKIRKMFATHSDLFFYDWEELKLDQNITLNASEFLDWMFLDKENARAEMEALHEFRRMTVRDATCPVTKVWAYLSINLMASAFTIATKSLAETYHQTFPQRSPLVYLGGQLHLNYDQALLDWNNPNMTSYIENMTYTDQQKQVIKSMMNQFAELGIKQWDNLLIFLKNEDRRSILK